MMQALGKRILVKVPPAPSETMKSGLYIPTTSDQSAIISGVVVSIGSDVQIRNLVNATVWFNKFTAAEVSPKGEKLYSCTVDELFAVEYPETQA